MKPKYTTEEGEATPQPLSDLQRYNKILAFLMVNAWAWWALVVWTFYYIAKHDILTRVARMCLG